MFLSVALSSRRRPKPEVDVPQHLSDTRITTAYSQPSSKDLLQPLIPSLTPPPSLKLIKQTHLKRSLGPRRIRTIQITKQRDLLFDQIICLCTINIHFIQPRTFGIKDRLKQAQASKIVVLEEEIVGRVDAVGIGTDIDLFKGIGRVEVTAVHVFEDGGVGLEGLYEFWCKVADGQFGGTIAPEIGNAFMAYFLGLC